MLMSRQALVGPGFHRRYQAAMFEAGQGLATGMQRCSIDVSQHDAGSPAEALLDATPRFHDHGVAVGLAPVTVTPWAGATT